MELLQWITSEHESVLARFEQSVVSVVAPERWRDPVGAVPDRAAGLAGAGIDEAAVPWLYRMWDTKPASFFVQWEAIGHRVNHVGEMVSVRDRLGLSPF